MCIETIAHYACPKTHIRLLSVVTCAHVHATPGMRPDQCPRPRRTYLDQPLEDPCPICARQAEPADLAPENPYSYMESVAATETWHGRVLQHKAHRGADGEWHVDVPVLPPATTTTSRAREDAPYPMPRPLPTIPVHRPAPSTTLPAGLASNGVDPRMHAIANVDAQPHGEVGEQHRQDEAWSWYNGHWYPAASTALPRPGGHAVAYFPPNRPPVPNALERQVQGLRALLKLPPPIGIPRQQVVARGGLSSPTGGPRQQVVTRGGMSSPATSVASPTPAPAPATPTPAPSEPASTASTPSDTPTSDDELEARVIWVMETLEAEEQAKRAARRASRGEGDDASAGAPIANDEIFRRLREEFGGR